MDNDALGKLKVETAMSFFLRRLFFFALSAPAFALAAPDNRALPVTPVAAAPAFLDVVTFNLHQDGENHKTVVTTGPGLLRVDEPDDGYSVIYDAQTDFYTGLEHGNYTYWEFSWPEVRAAVEGSKRGEARLQELNIEGASMENSPATGTPDASATSASVPDNSGYVWRQTTDRKNIAGLDCVRWTGDTLSGEGIEAWCFAGDLPKIRAAMERLRTINDPVALVPVRTLVPSLVFPAYDALVRGGVTPMQISWGGDLDKNNFSVMTVKIREGEMNLFSVPKLYMKTTLITMDGMIIQKNKSP